MTLIKENDLMMAFYLASPPLQKQILTQYQRLTAKNNIRKNLLTFLEEQFRPELTMGKSNIKNNFHHICL